MAWANGGGVTYEVASSPDGAGLDDFDWRVSLAEIASSRNFSAFGGVDRILLVVGEGMTLRVDGVDQVALPLVPLSFPGEAVTSCSLSAGPTSDLNVMVRRSRCTATLDALASTPTVECVADPGETVLLVVLEGAWLIDEESIELGERDALLVEGRVRLTGAGSVARIGLRPVPDRA